MVRMRKALRHGFSLADKIIVANINLQQAYWSAESTNLDVTKSLWDFMSVRLALSIPCDSQSCRHQYTRKHGYLGVHKPLQPCITHGDG